MFLVVEKNAWLLRFSGYSEIHPYAFEVELLKNKVLRKTALKFLQLLALNMNTLSWL